MILHLFRITVICAKKRLPSPEASLGTYTGFSRWSLIFVKREKAGVKKGTNFIFEMQLS